VISNDDLPWNRRDHALFVCFAPFDAPRYAVSVVVEHGGGGSAVAAPIARDILLQALFGGTPPLTAYPQAQRPRIETQQRELKRHPRPLRPHRRQDVLSIRRQGREREALRLAALGEAALVPGAPDAPLPTERSSCVRFQELSTVRTRSQVHASSMTQIAAADRWSCVGLAFKNR
jgi:hypothetical protein